MFADFMLKMSCIYRSCFVSMVLCRKFPQIIIIEEEDDCIKRLQLQTDILSSCKASLVHDLIFQTWLIGAFSFYFSSTKHL